MTILVTPLTETHLVAAEEETGVRLVDSLRKFLLQDRFAVIDDELDFTGPQIISLHTFCNNYQPTGVAPGGFVYAVRV